MTIVAVLGAIGGAVAVTQQRDVIRFRLWQQPLAFILGALLSEAVTFARYYTTFGYEDPKIAAGVGVSVIEFIVISVVGCIALLITASVMHGRITRRSKGRAASGVPLS